MATIFELISGGLETNDLPARLVSQAGKIGGAGTHLTSLVSNPPSSIGNLMSGLSSVALPNINLDANFTASFGTLGNAIPSDLSSLTGGLTSAFGSLQGTITSNLIPQVSQFIEGVQALQRLSQTNFATLSGTASASSGASTSTGTGTGTGTATGTGTGAGTGTGTGTGTSSGSGTATPAAGTDPAAEARIKRLEEVTHLNAALSFFPSPLNAPGIVLFLHSQLKNLPRETVNMKEIPLVDEVTDLLSTVIALREMEPAALKLYIKDTVDQLAAFLTSNSDFVMKNFIDDMTALASHLDTAALKSEMQALRLRLSNIAAAVSSGNISGIEADITAANSTLDLLLPRITALNANLFDGQVEDSERDFQLLPLNIDHLMRQIVRGVKPANHLKLLEGAAENIEERIGLASPDALSKDVEDLLAQVTSAVSVLDVSAISEPLRTVADGARSAVDAVDRVMSEVASQAALLFDEVDRVLEGIDVASVTDSINRVFQNFSHELEQKVSELFAPVREALAQGVKLISDTVGSFDPEDIINALKELIATLTGVLKTQAVVDALNTIRQTIQTVADQLKALSFKPVTDQVVAAIEEITQALKAIDTSLLSTAVKVALNAAVAVLPGDLKPVTDPLAEELHHLIDEGPKPMLEQVLEQPEKLLTLIRQYSPDKLIGDELSKPFQALIAELEKFKPSTLLKPVQDALDNLKNQIRQSANPGQLLAPLETLFNQLLAQFDKLKPGELVKPFEDIVTGLIDRLLDALPADEFLDFFDAILARIKGVIDLASGVKDLFTTVMEMLGGLTDPEAQLREWLNPTLNHINSISDLSSLQPSFNNVAQAINRLRAASLKTALDVPLQPLKAALTNLNPQGLLGDLSSAYRSIRRDAVNALSASTTKTHLLALLDRFNPLDVTFGRPFEGMKRWLETITRDESSFDAVLVHWDVRFHSAGAPLSDFIIPSVNAENLKTIFRNALEEEFIKPMGSVLSIFGALAGAVNGPLQKVKDFIEAFQTRMTDLLLGPDSFGGINDALHQLVDRLRAIDLQFLVRELEETFATVKAKLQAVSPTAIRAIVEQTFNSALDLLDTSQLLPASEVSAIDETYKKIIDDLKKLDPKKLVIDVVQPEFDKTVVPLLKTFDISDVIKIILDRLDGLEGELKGEFERVNKAYQEMLKAVPSISLADIDIDIDIDVDIGF